MYAGEWPDYDMPVLGTRPQYEVVATYTLQLSDNNYDWEVTGVSYDAAVPGMGCTISGIYRKG